MLLFTMEVQDDDAGLMLRYRDGDAAAFSALYAHYKGPLYRYLSAPCAQCRRRRGFVSGSVVAFDRDTRAL